MGNEEKIIVVHIDTDLGWRGGQQQAFYLHTELLNRNIKSHFICKKNSMFEKKFLEKNIFFRSYSFFGKLDIISALKVASYCKKINANIIHAHSSRALSTALLIKHIYPKAKLVASRRVDFKIGANVFSKGKYLSKKLDKIICISENIKKVMLACGISEEKLEVAVSGVDTDKYKNIIVELDFKQKNNLPENKIIIGTVAALADHKDYPTLMKAAKIILGKRKDVFFCSLGDGRLKEDLLKLSESLGIDENFKFYGHRDDVGKFLKIFDIFVLSSKMEGLGTSIIYAMALGLPIVASNAGGIPEIIKHEKNGLLFEKQNAEMLAEEIMRLLNDNDLRKRLSRQALIDSENFSFKKMTDENLRIYTKVLFGQA